MSIVTAEGKVERISGPVVVARGLVGASMYGLVRVGDLRLMGEIIRLDRDRATIQVYEETSGLKVGEPVSTTGAALSVELGPGLLGSIFDGVQRPLPEMVEQFGDYLPRSATVPALNRARLWRFTPAVSPGDRVSAGDVLGSVMETESLTHRVLVPAGVSGHIVEARDGDFTIEDVVVVINAETGNGSGPRRVECRLAQTWPVRRPRPVGRKLDPTIPLVTGQRIVDTLFPIAKGGVAVIPGGFGTGKTVLQQTLAKWADADIVVYVACGERGNEVTDVLSSFPKLMDQRTGRPLIERTVLIANTSNMPVAAREASIYTGLTIAEYYRDMGYDVAVMADSTSRWAEALREVSGRLEEMPGEEGYPAYLASRLADFYERSGRVACLGSESRIGSVTMIGAVSPQGGDFSEPVTQHSLRVAGTFWGLDSDLAHRRHFPAISWTRSYSLYLPLLTDWYGTEVSARWRQSRDRAMQVLQREIELQEVVQVVGPDALPENERGLLEVGRLIREDFLQQFALDAIDGFCPLPKQIAMLEALLAFQDALDDAIQRGVSLQTVMALPEVAELAQMKRLPHDGAAEQIASLVGRLVDRIKAQES